MFKLVVLFSVAALAAANPGVVVPAVQTAIVPGVKSVSAYDTSIVHPSPLYTAKAIAPSTLWGGYGAGYGLGAWNNAGLGAWNTAGLGAWNTAGLGAWNNAGLGVWNNGLGVWNNGLGVGAWNNRGLGAWNGYGLGAWNAH